MKKFNTVNDIMAEFFLARLHLYKKRKEYQMKVLSQKLEKEQHKIRFITMIVNHELIFRNKTKGALLTELEQLKFPRDSHDYLLGMSLWNMTHDKIEQLKQEQLTTKHKLETLRQTTIQQMWLKDLAEIQTALNTQTNSCLLTRYTRTKQKRNVKNHYQTK